MTKTQINPLLQADAYKFSHMLLYPEGTQHVYETLTPRKNAYFPWDDKMTVFGYTIFFNLLKDNFQENFFDKPWRENVNEIYPTLHNVMGDSVANTAIEKFHDLYNLGYLPLEVKALDEGTQVPMRVPVLTIENTHPDFYWLPGYLETILLSNTFVTSTVASVSRQFRKVGQKFADLTADDDAFLDYQFHDFSERGQHGNDSALLSGMAHLTSFNGTDVMQAPALLNVLEGTHTPYGGSVLATEHSVMEAYSTNQLYAYKTLVENNPEGILSVVSDTYDYWEVLTEVLPELKEQIISRNGKLVIRPDSLSEGFESVEEELVASLESLWATFGGTVNSKGYRVLDSHIGILHGEGVNLDTIEPLFTAIADAGFSTENIVIGLGAYVYSVLVSRDSFGQALKATSVTINGEEKAVFKSPKSKAEAFKKSQLGRVKVINADGEITLVDDNNKNEFTGDEADLLQPIFVDGKVKAVDFDTTRKVIRESVKG